MFSQYILCAHVCLVLSSNHHKPFSAVFSKGNLHSFFYTGQETKHNLWLLFSIFPLYPTLVTPTDSPNMSICLYLDISILAQASIISHLNYWRAYGSPASAQDPSILFSNISQSAPSKKKKNQLISWLISLFSPGPPAHT